MAMLIPLLAGGAVIALGTKKKKPKEGNQAPAAKLPPGQVPAGPPGSPEAIFTVDALDAFTEWRSTVNAKGQSEPTRYFKPAVQQGLYKMLNAYRLQPLGAVDGAHGGKWCIYELLPGYGMDPGQFTAASALAIAHDAGFAVAGSLWLMIPDAGRRRYIATFPPYDRAVFGQKGEQWAILSDGGQAQAPQAPQAPPIQPGPPNFPGAPYGGAPQAPPQAPYGGAPQAPPQAPYGGAPQAPPQAPYGGAPQAPPQAPYGGAPQAPNDGLDPAMPPELRSEVLAMLKDVNLSSGALEKSADAIAGDFPLAAAMLRNRAAGLKAQEKIEDAKQGGTPFRLRTGDLPYRLAQWYTGSPKGEFDGDAERWREIVPINKGMTIGPQGPSPWKVGSTILLPLAWSVRAKPLPPVLVASTRKPERKGGAAAPASPGAPSAPKWAAEDCAKLRAEIEEKLAKQLSAVASSPEGEALKAEIAALQAQLAANCTGANPDAAPDEGDDENIDAAFRRKKGVRA